MAEKNETLGKIGKNDLLSLEMVRSRFQWIETVIVKKHLLHPFDEKGKIIYFLFFSLLDI